MKEKLEARLKELTQQAEQLLADLNYTVGRKDEIIHVLNLLKEDENADKGI